MTTQPKSNGSMAFAPPFFSMGLETFKVSVKDVFCESRSKLVSQLTQSSSNDANQGVVYLVGSPSTTRFDSDHEPLFRQESYFYWLSGVKEPDCSLSIQVETGHTCLYVPELPPSYATIMGKIRTLDEWKELYQVDQVQYTKNAEYNLLELLTDNTSENASKPCSKLLLVKGLNSDSGNWYEPPKLADKQLDAYVDTDLLFGVLAECRVSKSPAERAILQHVTEVTSFAHAYLMRNFKPGMMEYQGESLFRHYCYYNYGCRLVGYTPICGCGPSGVVLHYGHAGEPNSRQSGPGDMALFDMGAEYFGYGSDVTCSWPVGGVFTDQQRPIYQAVLNAQVAVYDMIRPGVSYVDCHKAAEAAILKELVAIGIVVPGTKTMDELVEMRLGAVFMPHGLGHFIGIDTHDVGGYLAGHPERINLPGLKSLRTARILEANMILTVEPGCYFIDHILDDALASDSPLRPYLNASILNTYRGFGGVRLEDVIVVVDTGCVNYTLCPRTVKEVESVMAGGKWPPIKDAAPALRRMRLCAPAPLAAPPSI